MTATLLPPQDLAFFRSIAKTSAVLLICLRIDELHPGRAIADYEVADILEIDPRTVSKQMRSLSAYGLVLEQRESRYVVTPLGRNTLFSRRQSTSLSIEETEIISGTLEISAHNVCLNDDESISNHEIEFNSSSSINERTKCAELLDATHLLFGTSVNASGILDREPEQVLAWIAKAYEDRHKLNNPQGLVYARLRDNVQAPAEFVKEPEKFLPDDYLQAVGVEKTNQTSGSGFLCLVCHSSPCACEEHPYDCDCINCKIEHPERFCKKTVKVGQSFRACNQHVIPGNTYCEEHETCSQ